MGRIFVTGGAGYIGSHTILQLLRAGHDVMSFDNYANSAPEALERVQELGGKTIDIFEGDICREGDVERAVRGFKPDTVIHFAGLKAVGESVEHPLRYYRTNVMGTQFLLESMQANGCSNIVFSSSATVYGDAQYLPVDEDHPINPANPYGRTKAFVEGIIRDWCVAWPDASAALLRYFNPVGAHISGQIGEDPSDIPNNLMPYIARVATGRLEQVSVFGDDYETRDGTGERDYIHVVDLADAHVAAFDYLTTQTGCEAFNIGTGTGITVLEMLQAFERAAGKKIPYRVAGRRSGDVARSLGCSAKAERVLGWTAARGVDDMCVSTWRWQSEYPDGYAS